MNVTIAFAHVSKKLRKSRRMSQAELARLSGLDRTFISLLERGLRQPSLNTVFSLSKSLNMSASDMIKLIERATRKARANSLPNRRL